MADVKWIKILTDIFDDEKILLIETLPEADSIIVIWFKLLCLAGKQNNSGVFMFSDKMPYNEKMFATIFRRKDSTVQLAFKTFEDFGMVEIIEGAVTIPNWGKHQTLDKIEHKNEYMKNYMADYRSKQKFLVCKTNSKTNSKTNVSSLEEELELDIDKIKIKREAFRPPSMEDVIAYCQERDNKINPQNFIDFYSSKNWMVGKNKMTDWKACIRTWESREQKKSSNPFMDQLKKEVEDEQKGNTSDIGGNQSGFSRLLSGQQLE